MSLRFTHIHYWRDSLHWLCRLQCAFVGSALQLRQTAQRRSHEIGWLLMWVPSFVEVVRFLVYLKKHCHQGEPDDWNQSHWRGAIMSRQLKGQICFFCKNRIDVVNESQWPYLGFPSKPCLKKWDMTCLIISKKKNLKFRDSVAASFFGCSHQGDFSSQIQSCAAARCALAEFPWMSQEARDQLKCCSPVLALLEFELRYWQLLLLLSTKY